MLPIEGRDGLLFLRNSLELDRAIIVLTSTCRTQPIKVMLDIVVAELTHLRHSERLVFVYGRATVCATYLVTAGTWVEILVLDVELFYTERAWVLISTDVQKCRHEMNRSYQVSSSSSIKLS